MFHPFQGLIVQVDMGQFHVGVFHRLNVHGKTMILRGDLHPAGLQVFDRLVGPPVSEFEFKSGPAQGQSQDLMAQTDAEDGQHAQKILNRLNNPRIGGRISGSVGK